MGTAELYLPSSNVSCTLPKLFGNCWDHTVESSGLLCGGQFFWKSCWQWKTDTGTWEKVVSHMAHPRREFVSWTPDSGIGTYLIGGYDSQTTTTLITPEGTQEPGFKLKYDTE